MYNFGKIIFFMSINSLGKDFDIGVSLSKRKQKGKLWGSVILPVVYIK